MGFNVKIIACHYIHTDKNNTNWYWYNVIKFHSNSNAHNKPTDRHRGSFRDIWNWVAKPWLVYPARASGFSFDLYTNTRNLLEVFFFIYFFHLTWVLIENRKSIESYSIYFLSSHAQNIFTAVEVSPLVHHALYWQLLPFTYWNLIWLFQPPTSIIQWQTRGIWRLIAPKVSAIYI